VNFVNLNSNQKEEKYKNFALLLAELRTTTIKTNLKNPHSGYANKSYSLS